ncbi:MAG: type II toxin-antitoxin system antitoxin VapB [Eubacteriales bacterium]
MDTAKIFENGRSQAVRLPKEYRFSGDDVFIKKIDDVVMLIPKDKVWKIFRESLNKFSDDIVFQRDNDKSQSREIIK